MIFTKGIYIEEIKRRINGGNPSAPSRFKEEDITILLGHCINARIKADFITNTLAMGETIPEGSQYATYMDDTAISVYKYGAAFSAIDLPAMPVKLMRDMGVALVCLNGDIDNPFIPMQNGLHAYLIRQKMINELLGQIGYTQAGKQLIFTQDLTAGGPVKVMLQLLVADIFMLDDYDPLPITADMQSDLVEEVVAKLSRAPMQDKRNDVTTVVE